MKRAGGDRFSDAFSVSCVRKSRFHTVFTSKVPIQADGDICALLITFGIDTVSHTLA